MDGNLYRLPAQAENASDFRRDQRPALRFLPALSGHQRQRTIGSRAAPVAASGHGPQRTSGAYLRYGSIGIRGAGGVSLRVGDEKLLTGLRAGHPLYDQTLGLLAGAEMASNSSTGEDFDVCLDTPATAFGFNIVEVMTKPEGVTDDEFKLLTGDSTLKQSTFTITFFNGANQVGNLSNSSRQTMSPPSGE